MLKRKNSSLVYSSERGRVCGDCGKAKAECRCGKKENLVKGSGVVRVGRQTKGRKGKGVTIITGVPLAGEQLKELAKALKQKCGTGGTVKNGTIEIQGDHRDVLVEELKQRGWDAKRSGG